MDINDVLENAGTMKGAPPPPNGKLPRQYLPAIIRWPIRVAIMPFIWLDLAAQKIARMIVRPPNVRAGACKKRGNCCHYIMIRKVRAPFGWLDLFWHTEINGFFRRDKKVHVYNGMNVHIMGCRYLTKEGKCGRYTLRPIVCRTWPRIEYFGYPQILKGCGFHAAPRKAKSKLQVIPD